MLTFIAFIIILGVLVFVHELGHFTVAKWSGMKVDEFAIGFPPKIFSWKRKETTYSLNAIPFGGFVKIRGENPENQDDDPGSYNQKSVWKRIAVVLAGIAMNTLFAFVVLVIAFSVGFTSYAQDLSTVPGAVVKHSEVIVIDTLKDSPAAKAELQPGDQVVSFSSVDGTGSSKSVRTVADLTSYTKQLQTGGVSSVQIQILRDGSVINKEIGISPSGPPLGVSIQPYNIARVPIWRAPEAALKEMNFIIRLTWDALAQFGQKLFVKAELDPNVSGPVGIYQATGAATQAGVIPTIFLVVVLSLNLALLNVLPIPALDGGKLFFLLIEVVFRKRPNARLEGAVSFGSFVLLIGLLVVLSVRDVANLF